MQIGFGGIGYGSGSEAAATFGSSLSSIKSVGQRLKDASRGNKDINIGGTAASLNGTCATAKGILQKEQQRNLRVPLVLTELQKNTVRVIGQYLRELGMNDTVDSLVEETGCRIENPLSMKLRESIQNGHWQKALELIEKIRSHLTEKQYFAVRVILLEEKFKEFVARGEHLSALRVLQIEYPKCRELRSRLELLSTQLCSSTASQTFQRECSDSETVSIHLLNVLRRLLPPSIMLPPNRLQELLKQSWLYQTKQCDLHVLSREQNILDDRSILVDHQCSSREFPSKNTCTLYMHNAEVWCVKFSPCGRFIASGAKGNQVLVWKVESPTTVNVFQSMQILQDVQAIGSISWSYDSRYLAVCAAEQPIGTGCFIYYVPSGRLVKEYTRFTGDSFASVSFFKDKSHKLACAGQKGHFHVYDIHRPEDNAKMFEGFRIRCLYACSDGKTVLAADTHNRIRKYDFETQREHTIIQESSQIMHFTVGRNESCCLITTKTEGIRLWCLKTNTLIRTFFGANHNDYVITSTFGGPDDSFCASGSEDNTVTIWNLRRSNPVWKLHGHLGTVNTVSWNPADTQMLASGSDDGTIRIWSTAITK